MFWPWYIVITALILLSLAQLRFMQVETKERYKSYRHMKDHCDNTKSAIDEIPKQCAEARRALQHGWIDFYVYDLYCQIYDGVRGKFVSFWDQVAWFSLCSGLYFLSRVVYPRIPNIKNIRYNRMVQRNLVEDVEDVD